MYRRQEVYLQKPYTVVLRLLYYGSCTTVDIDYARSGWPQALRGARRASRHGPDVDRDRNHSNACLPIYSTTLASWALQV